MPLVGALHVATTRGRSQLTSAGFGVEVPVSSLRRYAPFALLVAAQLVLVLVAPSRGATGTATVGGQFGGTTPQSTVSAGAAPPGAAPGTVSTGPAPSGVPAAAAPGTTVSSGPAATSGPAAPGTATSGSGKGTGGVPVLAPASGSTTSTPFCVTGVNEHAPCARTWTGGNNGGTTWTGVTAKTITVVMYRPKDNAAVNAILQTTGTYISASAEKQQFLLVTDWINKHFQLYGRTIKPVYVQGSCDIAPPVDSCFRSDADSVVAKYKPVAVFWDNDTNEAAFWDELSRKGVLNWGGWHLADSFDDGLRPYHYDLFMGGDVQAEFAGTWYCRRLAGRKAQYAGSADLRAKTRKVVVVYPDTPATTPAAQHLERIIAGCAGSSAVIDGKYSSNTSTAAQQATTNTAKYKSAGATSVLWFSDPIAPAYATKAQAAQNWYPEQVLAGSGLVDYDALAQTYDQGEWAHAFGPSDLGKTPPIDQTDAGRIWKAEGRSGSPNANANLLTSYELAIASGLMAAGPKLTPLTFEYGLLEMPGYDAWSSWHDPRLVYLDWGRADYTGISDIREVYYDPNLKSPTNGRNGGYVPLNGGQRYLLNQLPAGEPKLPSSV